MLHSNQPVIVAEKNWMYLDAKKRKLELNHLPQSQINPSHWVVGGKIHAEICCSRSSLWCDRFSDVWQWLKIRVQS